MLVVYRIYDTVQGSARLWRRCYFLLCRIKIPEVPLNLSELVTVSAQFARVVIITRDRTTYVVFARLRHGAFQTAGDPHTLPQGCMGKIFVTSTPDDWYQLWLY